MFKVNSLIYKCDSFYKIARKAEDLAILKANIGNYVHFSNSDRLGINYGGNLHPGNPKAIYGFPFTSSKYQKIIENKPAAFYDYGYSRYIYIFNVSGNILDMDNINLEDEVSKINKFVRTNYPKGSYHASYIPTITETRIGPGFLRWINDISSDIFKNNHSGVNVLIRGLGYDAMETKNYGFGDDIASEIAVLNPSAINLIAKINNPMITKEQLKEIEWYQSPEYIAQEAEKKKIRDEELKKREENIKIRLQWLDEYRALYTLERDLVKEKKFDEAERVRKEFQEKWKPLQHIINSTVM